MSSIFISHSGQDSERAAEIKAWLDELRYRSVFLDRDPKTGIPTGEDWEQVIFRSLDHCRAVILLCSKHAMESRWCFAEIAHTRALGKAIFPLIISTCDIWPELQDTQFLDMTQDRAQALEQLGEDLKRVVKDQWTLPWDGSRSPYPGLLAFDKEDAAIFFGRERETREGMEVLNRLRRFPGTRLALVVGASGTGKSSLMRAGILPRLERDRRNWLIVDPFRPLGHPFAELSQSLSVAFDKAGAGPSFEEISTTLEEAARQSPPDGAALVELARKLRISAGAREATVLLPIDQFEELLGSSRSEQSGPFLGLLRAALEQDHSPLLVLATLRSDFIGLFRQDPALRQMRFRGFSVGAMFADGFRRIIEGPAEVDGLKLEEGLVEAMVEDTQTEDALPLLAFALGELYEKYGDDRKLAVTDYRDKLGGLSASVGRAAAAVLEAHPLSERDERALRSALLSLVEIDDKGRYARRPVRWSDLPESVHPILERFVQAHFLKSDGDGETRTVEVRHEALFRTWDKMIAWLNEDQEFLLWRKRIDAAVDGWRESGRSDGALLQGAPLTEARHWLSRRHQSLTEDLRKFIDTSTRIARRTLHRKLGLAAAMIAVVALLVSMIVASNFQEARLREAWKQAEDARRRAEIAEDDAVAHAQRARMTEREASHLVELLCDQEEVEACLERLASERGGE